MKLSKLEALSGSQLFLMNCCKDHCHCTNSMSALKNNKDKNYKNNVELKTYIYAYVYVCHYDPPVT